MHSLIELCSRPQLLHFDELATERSCSDSATCDDAPITRIILDILDAAHAMSLNENVRPILETAVKAEPQPGIDRRVNRLAQVMSPEGADVAASFEVDVQDLGSPTYYQTRISLKQA